MFICCGWVAQGAVSDDLYLDGDQELHAGSGGTSRVLH